MRAALLLLSTAALFTVSPPGAEARDATTTPPPLEAEFLADHPLAGVIVGPDGARLSAGALVEQLVDAPLILLGEQHDHPDHHRLRAWLIEQLVASGRSPALVFEHVHTGLADALADCVSSRCDLDEALPHALEWEARWPNWSMFRPLFEAAWRLDLDVEAGNAPPDRVRALARGERVPGEALAETLDARPDARRAELRSLLARSHCDLLPDEALDGMLVAQTARDLAMADAMHGHDDAILLAGNGHVDSRLGVPWILGLKPDAAQTRAVVFAPVSREYRTVEAARAVAPAADYIWFTPRVSMDDPCDRMREAMDRATEP